MIWLGTAALAAFCIFARMAHDAPVGEEVEGFGFVTDPRQLRELRRQQDARHGQSEWLRRLPIGEQVNNLDHIVGDTDAAA